MEKKYGIGRELQATVFCTFFYGKFDVNMINTNGDSVLSLLAKENALSNDALKLFSEHEFDFFRQYIGFNVIYYISFRKFVF